MPAALTSEDIPHDSQVQEFLSCSVRLCRCDQGQQVRVLRLHRCVLGKTSEASAPPIELNEACTKRENRSIIVHANLGHSSNYSHCIVILSFFLRGKYYLICHRSIQFCQIPFLKPCRALGLTWQLRAQHTALRALSTHISKQPLALQ